MFPICTTAFAMCRDCSQCKVNGFCWKRGLEKGISVVEAFWIVTSSSDGVGYQCLRGPCCFHLQGEVAEMGGNSIDIGPAWRGAAVPTSQ